MAKLNLKSMSLEELVALRDRIQAELSRKIGQERGALQKQIDALAELDAGGRVPATSQVVSRRRGSRPTTPPEGTRAGKKIEPKYRGPDGATWTGRGRAPRWLTELEATGKKRENYLIRT